MAAPNDYIAFYKLENDASDETGNYNGTATDIVFDGKMGSFNGSSSKVALSQAASDALDGASGATFSFWVKTNSIANSGAICLTLYTSEYAKIWVQIHSDGSLEIGGRTIGSDNYVNAFSDFNIQNDELNFLTVVVDLSNSKFQIYENSILDVEKSQIFNNTTFQHSSGGNTNSIGGYSSGRYLNGYLSHARLYNRALTTEEITSIYDEEYTKFYNHKDTDTTSGYIEATATDGYAISQPIVQDTGDTDFTSVQNIVGKFELANISVADTADELKTNELITTGDNLVIVKDNNSIHEVIASGISGSGPYTMDTTSITAGEIPTRVFRDNESVFFNSNEATFVSNSYTAGTPLLVDKTFDTVQTPGRKIETKVQMSATGNKMTQLDFDIFKSVV